MPRIASKVLVAPALALVVALAPSLAFAHAGGDHVHGLAEGLAHPLTGLDHALAMIAVGLIACRIGGRALWLVPAAFVGSMVVGAALEIGGVGFDLTESVIAASLVLFGAVVAAGLRLPAPLAIGLAALAGLVHGHAHGSELDASASAYAYAAGFVVATAALHGLGVVAGLKANAVAGRLIQAAGAATALFGAALLAGVA